MVVVVTSTIGCHAFTSLGSPKPESCNLSHFCDCPSHFMCTTDYGSDAQVGYCTCDRYYGFMGNTCQQKSAASYVLLICHLIAIIIIVYAIRANIILGYQIWLQRKLKQKSAIFRTLIFNFLVLPPLAVVNSGTMLIILDVDRDMYSYQYLYPWCASIANFFLVTSTLSLSLVWIEMVQGIGQPNTTLIRHASAFRMILYSSSCGFALGSIYFLAISQSGPLYALFSIIMCTAIALSYYIAGRNISKILRRTESSPTSLSKNSTISLTSTVTKLLFGIILFAVVSAFTTPSRTPLYAAQNSLPRIVQGQLTIIMVRATIFFRSSQPGINI
jgi:hypothetical protein